MKFISSIALLTFSTYAFSFTTATLNKDVVLKVKESGIPTHWSIEGSGTKYCYVKINATTNQEASIIKAGTNFEITQILAKECEWDWERVCGVSFHSVNKEKNLELNVTCKDKGMLASPVTPARATKFTKGFLTIK